MNRGKKNKYQASVAEWSKALVSGTGLFGGVGSNPTTCILMKEWGGIGVEDSVAEWSKACDSKSLLLWRRRFKSCHCRFLVGKYMSGAKQGGGHIGSLRQGKESKESTTKRAG